MAPSSPVPSAVVASQVLEVIPLLEDAGHVSAVGAYSFVAGGGQVAEAFDRIVAQVSIECDGVITLSVVAHPVASKQMRAIGPGVDDEA